MMWNSRYGFARVSSRSPKLVLMLSMVAAALAGSAAQAHHSFGMFDPSECRQLNGTVHSFEWAFPHSWVWVDAPQAGTDSNVTWGFEGGSPVFLLREGWKRDSLKPGDKVTVWYAPLRSGKPGGSLAFVVLADGSSFNTKANVKCQTDWQAQH